VKAVTTSAAVAAFIARASLGILTAVIAAAVLSLWVLLQLRV
jgi:hypothetical protein